MLERVLVYVRSVLAGEAEGNVAVGRYLMDTLSASTPALDKGRLEQLFNSHLQVRFWCMEWKYLGLKKYVQDTLMMSYLGNLVRSQVEVAARLTLLS